MVLVKVIAVKQ